jgi:hypothetical protein
MMLVQRIPYSQARPFMRTGDPVGSRSGCLIGRGIRFFKGGVADWSHIMTVMHDTTVSDRLTVVHAVNKGMVIQPLTSIIDNHGDLFWFPVRCDEEQRQYIRELAAALVSARTGYDWWLTISAIWKPMRVCLNRLNCSEAWWHLMTASGRFDPRYDKRGRMLAPAPGDAPRWAGVDTMYQLIF